MNFNAFVKSVAKIRNLELPGEQAHLYMFPPYRSELMEMMKEERRKARKAAVMVLFYPDRSYHTNLVLILRKTYRGVHSAQVGFPGGKVEREDQSMLHSAIRETEEEVGVRQGDIQVIKSLSNVYIPPSNFSVYPFLGILDYTPLFTKQDEEVEDILEINLADFLSDHNVVSKPVMTSFKKELEVPAFTLGGQTVWGATAMILSEVKELLKQVI